MSLPTREDVVSLLGEIEAARRASRLYPPTHPAAESACDRLRACSAALPASSDVTVGVTSDAFLWEGRALPLAAAAPARSLQDTLFRLGIAALRLRPAGEALVGLARLLAELGDERNEASRLALIEGCRELDGVDLLAIEAVGIHLADDHAEEAPPPGGLWNQLAVRLVADGILPWHGAAGGPLVPERVVEALTRAEGGDQVLAGVFGALAETLEADPSAGGRVPVAMVRGFLAELLALLPPDRRNRAIVLAADHLPLDLREPPDGPTLVDIELVVSAIEQLLDRDGIVPEPLALLLERISSRPELREIVGAETASRAAVLLARREEAEPLAEPRPPAASLRAGMWSDRSSARALAAGLQEESMRRHLVVALSEIVSLWPREQVADRAIERLADELTFSLGVGDIDVASRLAPMLIATRNPTARKVLARETVAAALKALATVEKERYSAITAILAALGEAALPAILAALAEAEEAAIRKCLLEAVLRQESRAIPHVRPLLADHRWYVVRNAIFLLRRLRDPELPKLIRGRFSDSSPQVLSEVLKALIAAEDPRWPALLLRAVDEEDAARSAAALELAGKVRHGEVTAALVARLDERTGLRLREPGTRLLIAAIGEHRDPAALDALARIARLQPWKYPFAVSSLRAAATAAIAAIDSPEARKLAATLATDRDTAVARAATTGIADPGEEGTR